MIFACIRSSHCTFTRSRRKPRIFAVVAVSVIIFCEPGRRRREADVTMEFGWTMTESSTIAPKEKSEGILVEVEGC